MKKINPLYWLLGFAVLVSGWPFISYRFTDGDISHWINIASEIRKNFTFLTSNHDQFHGPFMAWLTALITLVKPSSFYLYNLTNAGCFVFTVWLSYFFSEKIFNSKKLALFNAVLSSTGLMLVYLSRTPMYDLPAAAFYFSFSGFYYLALKEKKDIYFWIAIISIGIAALSRFSISLGIAGVYMIGTQFLLRKSFSEFFKKIVGDGAIIILAGVLFNLPWIAGQIQAHGLNFLNGFYDDNVGRYLIEKTAHPKLNREYWAFPLYALIGMLPYTFLLLASIFKKGFWKEIKKDPLQQIMLLAFIPGLLLFSFSGHVKLGRYIAFVFPSLSVWLGYRLFNFELKDKKFIRRAVRFAYITLFFLGILLLAIVLSFKNESAESGLLTLSLGLLLFLSTAALARMVKKEPMQLINQPLKWLGLMAILYLSFFSVLNWQAHELSFLKAVNTDIQNAMGLTKPGRLLIINVMFLLKVIAIDEKIDDETESILSPTDTLDDFKKYNVLYPNPLYKINRGSPEAKIEIYIYRFPSDRHKDLYFEYSQKEINNQYYLLKEHLDFLAKYSHHFLRYPKVKLFLKSNVLSRNMGEYHPSRRHFSSKAVILNNTFYNLELSSIHLRTELFKTLIHEFGHKESFEIKNQKNFIQLLNIKTKLKNNSSSAQDKKLTEIIHEFVEHFARFEELIWGFTYTKEISSETVRKLRKAIRMLDLLSTVQNPNETLILINKIWKKLRPIYSFRTTVIP